MYPKASLQDKHNSFKVLSSLHSRHFSSKHLTKGWVKGAISGIVLNLFGMVVITVVGGIITVDEGVIIVVGGTITVDGGVIIVVGWIIWVDGGIITVVGGVNIVVGGINTVVGWINTVVGEINKVVGGIIIVVGGIIIVVGGVIIVVGGINTVVGGINTVVGGIIIVVGEEHLEPQSITHVSSSNLYPLLHFNKLRLVLYISASGGISVEEKHFEVKKAMFYF